MSADASPPAARTVTDLPGGNVALDLFVVNQHLGALLSRALDGLDMSPAQYAVYSAIGRHSLTPTLIGEKLGIRPPTLSGHLSAMEARGDLARIRSTTDRRSVSVSLTEQGLASFDEARTRFRRAIRAVNARLGDAAAIDQVRATLARVDSAVREACEQL